MAPRRGVRSVKSVNNINYSNISLGDVLCPICRCILIHPVTLPCSHDFCLPCFEGTLANANLTCPLCRIRFSSWHRIAKKDNKIINEKLWNVLQHKFADHVQNRLLGIEENLEEETPIQLTSPGEIRKEYEAQRRKQELEQKKLKEAEEKASAELIRKLKEQEEYEESVRVEKLRLDEKVARQIAKEMGFIPKPSVSKIVDIPKKRRPLDKYIKNVGSKKLPEFINSVVNKEKSVKQKNLMNFTIEITDSNDSIENECRYFKPIDHRNIPPSKCGTILRIPAKFIKATTSVIGAPIGHTNIINRNTTSAFARFEITSPINSLSSITSPSTRSKRKRKLSDPEKKSSPESEKIYSRCVKNLKSPLNHTQTTPKRRPSIRDFCAKPEVKKTKMTLRERKISGSPFYGFDSSEMQVNGFKDKEQQEKKDLEFAKKLQEEFNKERYSTRSSIICRNNVRKPRQVTLTEIMSTSKCK